MNEVTLLIVVEGAETPAGGRDRRDPTTERGGSRTARRQAKRLERKSTELYTFFSFKKTSNAHLHAAHSSFTYRSK